MLLCCSKADKSSLVVVSMPAGESLENIYYFLNYMYIHILLAILYFSNKLYKLVQTKLRILCYRFTLFEITMMKMAYVLSMIRDRRLTVSCLQYKINLLTILVIYELWLSRICTTIEHFMSEKY